MSRNKHFPCPYCTRLGEPSRTRGDCVDVSSGNDGPWMMQIAPDDLCGGCDGEGFIPIGSKRHFQVKLSSAFASIAKIFGEEFIYNIHAEIYEDFHKKIRKALELLEIEWLEYNKETKC